MAVDRTLATADAVAETPAAPTNLSFVDLLREMPVAAARGSSASRGDRSEKSSRTEFTATERGSTVATDRSAVGVDTLARAKMSGRNPSDLIPQEMKYGAAANPWDRVLPHDRKQIKDGMEALAKDAVKRLPASMEITKTGVVSRDEKGRVITLDQPDKNRKVHLVYEGSSKSATALILEDAKTGKKTTLIAVDKADRLGNREWISVNNKGELRHWTGDARTTEKGNASFKLKNGEFREPGRVDRTDRTDLKPKREEGDRRTERTRPHGDSASAAGERAASREQLRKTALKYITNPAERTEYLKNIARFEEAAKKFGHSDKEVADFYKQSARLLSTPSKLVSQASKVRIAQDAIKQAIKPTTIDQGYHNTCNVATIEVNMYSRNPSKALKAVTDAALTGTFVTSDGSRIKIPPKTLEAPTRRGDGQRSFASQIFQELAVNTYWQKQSIAPDGTRVRPGDLRYTHGFKTDRDGDTGQRMWKESDGGRILDQKKKQTNQPHLSMDKFPKIYEQIAGKRPDLLAIGREGFTSAVPGVKAVSSEADLHKTLSTLASKKGGFPIILQIHTGHEPWRADSGEGKAGGSGGWHVVNITGYDPRTKRVSIDNQWGTSSDHEGRKAVSLKQIYDSMTEPTKVVLPPHWRR